MPRLAASQSIAWLRQLMAEDKDYAVVLLDDSGQIVDWLGAAEHVFGFTAAEAIGQPFGLLFTPEDRTAGMDRGELEVARTTGRSEDDRWHWRKGGIRFWGSGILRSVRATDGRIEGFCKIVRDRTDIRTQLEAMLNRIDVHTGELARRARFMVRLGHELRNPLGAIRATSYLIQKVGDPTLKRHCEVLDRQVGVLARLLDDMGEITRADAHVASIQPERVLLQDAVQSAEAGVRDAVAAKRQHLAVVVPEVPVHFEADPVRLQQMLLNLLTNACKFTPEGGHISLSASVDGAMVVIHVVDDGVGIEPELLPHIFELFTRANDAGPRADGLGVGLAVVKELAVLHGGGVEARSGAQGGSVFTLRLPLVHKRA
ncbi:MAG TPA: PAS domain-containing sensor histidine kinase [Albitalea sp.]|uniref:PAS domain-containing sensor histidine kinase n=1 Tax=Piscinibacter sp. TaxID=1903157 RepID=UPI002ED1D8C2